ncbi:DUF2637 domain-containing protein [Streptomyces sp. NPDC018584]|uniref:DUF2637 domain-containing protein n=1 Tax=unclassified Streptomyces TaxID=2593676 RepID=UPI0037A0DF01
MTSTPAGNEPHRPNMDGPLAPTAPGTPPTTPQPLTRTQKILTGIVVGAVLIIATLGFIGSYAAVTHLALAKGFGQFAHAFPIAVDAGIIAFLALDLLLTWRRIAFPLLRYTAWGLTGATIAFNAVVSWPDPVGTGMHGVIPVLFVIAVEAARHAIGRIADITADKHIEGPPVSRWLLNPPGTFVLWRRQRLWGIRSWDTVVSLERERRIYRAQLRKEHGRAWRRKATADQTLVLRLTADGMSVQEAIALPAREEEKRRAEADRIARERQRAEDERRREAEAYQKEQERLDEERRQKDEERRLNLERKQLQLDREREEAERLGKVADAETRAKLAEIARCEQEAQAAAEQRRRQEQVEAARRIAEEQERAAQAARNRQEAEAAARQEAERKEQAARRAAELLRAANATPANPANRAASANRTAASSSANASTTAPASHPDGSASTASETAANADEAASASSYQTTATTASAVDIAQLVDVYQLLKEQLGKAPSDQKLGDALGISRSRAQQVRTLAIQAGHTELAKPVRLAS